MAILKFTQDSAFKNEELGLRVAVKAGQEFPLSSYGNVDPKNQLLKVALGKDKNGSQMSVEGRNTWFVFRPHVLVLEEDGVSCQIPKENQDNREPKKGEIHLPGFTSGFDLNSPVIPGGWLTWAEVTHGGERIPKTKQEVENALALCKRIQLYRNRISKPFVVTSCFRPEPYNSRCGGVSNSKHLTLEAVDIYVDGWKRERLASEFEDWDGGLGIYNYDDYIIHLDIGAKRRWGF